MAIHTWRMFICLFFSYFPFLCFLGGYRAINLLKVNTYNNVFFKVQLCYLKKGVIKPLYQL